MVSQQRVAEELRSERERLTTYLESLPEAAWDKQSLCEGWTVKDVVAHTIGIAADVANRRLDGVGSAEANQRQVDERKDKTPRELIDEWNVEGKSLEDGLLELDDDFWNAPYTDNFTVGDALQRMVEDIWVHAHDIRIPLGDDSYASVGTTAVLEVAARDLQNRLPAHAPTAGKVSIQAGTFQSVVTGPGTADIVLSGDPIALALVTVGRTPLADAIRNGDIKVTPEIPAGLADAINIYGPQ